MEEILDACCGGRMFWFDKQNPDVLFTDVRDEEHTLCDNRSFKVAPDKIVDFRDMPFDDKSFSLIIFDPPHLVRAGDNSWMAKKYGKLEKDTWQSDLCKGFKECWRVLNPGGTLIFKWNETQIKLREVLACFPEKPLCGHTTTHNLKTHWLVFHKHRN
jgi:SAM-dependent methyltransferase